VAGDGAGPRSNKWLPLAFVGLGLAALLCCVWVWRDTPAASFLSKATAPRLSNPGKKGKKSRYLTKAQRARLPLKEFVFPSRRAWPIHDVRHALIAIRYMNMGRGHEEDYPKIIAAIKKRYGKNAQVKAALKKVQHFAE
jgi:hypothetical protein